MTTEKQNIDSLKNKINYINSYDFKNISKIYDKNTVKALAPNLKDLKGKNNTFSYPLSINTWDNKEYEAINNVIASQNFTMGEKVNEFEKKFAQHMGSKYAVMVNSGSSANLLAFFSLINPKNKKKLMRNDECLIPALCWSTSLWPIVQSGLKPKFVDVNVETLNVNLNDLKKKITKKNKSIFSSSYSWKFI